MKNYQIIQNTPSANISQLLDERKQFEQELEKFKKLIKQKGYDKIFFEDSYQKAFIAAEQHLRCELKLAGIFNALPKSPGARTDLKNNDKDIQTKSEFFKSEYGLSYKTGWKISKLTAECVEKTIQYAKENKELPTRRLALIVLRCQEIKDIKELIQKEREKQKLLQKERQKINEAKKIERNIQLFQAIQSKKAVTLPDKTYNVIYADTYQSSKDTEELKLLQIPSSKDSILFLWSKSSDIEKQLDIMKAWDFSYIDCIIWDRMDKKGFSKYFLNQHDLLLVGIKGEGLIPEKKEKSICRNPLKENETRLAYYFEMIEGNYPTGAYLDLFSTKPHNSKWTLFTEEREVSND